MSPIIGRGMISTMVKLNARFDGKVIIPDEPLALKPNQRIRISIEPVEAESAQRRTDFSEWIGLAATGSDCAYDPAEEDALWEKGHLRPPEYNNH